MSSPQQETVFKCSRCGYQADKICAFKGHLSRKTDCKPKLSDISFDAVKEQYAALIPVKRTAPTQPRRRRLRLFGHERRDYIKREFLKDCVSDPLKGVQTVISQIFFNEEHDENHNVRYLANDPDYMEIYKEENTWVKRNKQQIYDKMIYMACDILEYNIPKKYWTTEFANFVSGMGGMDNDDLLELIREEVESTVIEHYNNANNKNPSKDTLAQQPNNE